MLQNVRQLALKQEGPSNFEIWSEGTIKKSRHVYEFLYDVRPNKEILDFLSLKGVDLFSFVTRDFIRAEECLLYPHLMDNIALLKIDTYETWWNDQITKKTRNMIRKSEKSGVRVFAFRKVEEIKDDILIGIWKIYNETPIRQNRYFQNYGISLPEVSTIKEKISDKMELYCAYHNDEIIGFSEVMLGDRVAQISQILSLTKHFDKSPNNALLATIFNRCAKNGYPYVIYGRMGLAHPSLTKFKEANGFRRFNLTRYFVPITHKGSVAIRLGLHRQIRDIVPEKIKFSLLPLYEFISRTLRVEV